ncbi:MAG: ABC transporter ATP-binding protein [Filimonas sp.]|nr:ABC transporter ATP-binding protein [Filimonas sp.]
MQDSLLQVKDLSIQFENHNGITKALQHVSFEINKGELVAVVGESGSGKSITSLSVLRLLPSPPAVYNGSIVFHNDNTDINILDQSLTAMRQLRGHKIAMIFQEPMTSLNPVHTCGNQVMEAIQQHYTLSAEKAHAKTIQLFEQVKLPDPERIFKSYPHQVSGGQKQRVMIAMAMSCEPSLLICDEPTTALDVTVQKNILELIRELKIQNQMGVLFITHDLGVVSEIADRIIVMYKGKVVETGKAKELLANPQHSYTKALLACRPALHPKGERLPVVSDFLEILPNGEIRERIQNNEQGSKNNEQGTRNEELRTETPATGTKLLSVSNLQVWYPSKRNFLGKVLNYTKAVNDVSFDVYEGETLGLVGESGCGKSTLGRTLLRLIEPTGGEILYKGNDLLKTNKQQLKDMRRDMQLIFQDPYSSLNPRKTIGSAIAEPLMVHNIGRNDKERKDIVINLLEKVNLLPEHFNRYPHEFSGGQRQRIVIARALALKPTFVVCDESVSALDVSVQAQVLNLLNDLKKEFKFTAVFISHDLSVVRYISDRIMVMSKGMIEEIGEADAIYHSPKSEYTQRLIASIPGVRR